MNARAIAAPEDDIKKEYFNYLCFIADINSEQDSYFLLANDLHKHHFYSVIPNDDNRINDGKNLRQDFKEKSDFIDYDCIDGPCTFFEFLIGLSYRMAFILEDTQDEQKIGKYFHELLKNCGLDEATDDNYYSIDFDHSIVGSIIDRILERRYKKDGSGGLFPIKTWKNGDKDQRETEIWYQMARYLDERE